ncbi:MAG: hypothetical protein H5U03_08225, partial [Clostridia bacterium]|nr:hypothetical protein [Clostridia bacterium]
MQELSEVYHRLIQKQHLIISVNGEPIKPFQLDLMPGLRWDIDLKVGTKNVRGWVAAARPVRQGGQQNYTPGFYLVRRDRIVKKGEWIGHSYHSRLRTMVGEIELDDFEVNANKTDFLRDTPEWVQLDQSIRQFFADNKLVTRIYKGIKGKKEEVPAAETGKPQAGAGKASSPAPPEPPTQPPPSSGYSPPTFTSDVAPTAGEQPHSPGTPKKVFIIHGRDHTARDHCFCPEYLT